MIDSTAPARAPLHALVAMALVSSSVLVMQISLTRILSVVANYHAVFLVISMVMLGLSASAVDAYLRRVQSPEAYGPEAASFAAGRGALAAVVGLTVMLQAGRVEALANAGIVFGVLVFALAFYDTGWVVAWLLDRYARDVSRVYWVDLVGAALGCAVAVGVLSVMPTPAVVALCSTAIATAGLLLAPASRRAAGAVPVGISAVVLVASLAAPGQMTVHYAKGTDQSHVLFERWNTLARVVVTPEIPGITQAATMLRASRDVTDAELEHLAGLWRLGWGASERFTGTIPEMRWIELDAGAGTPIIQGGSSADLTFLEWDVTAAGHHMQRGAIDRSFVIGGGGGRDILTALQFGAGRVDVVEINPAVVEAVRDRSAAFVEGQIYDDPRVSLRIGDGRSALASSPERYDLIQMSMIDTWAASMSGAMVLSENTLYTQEAFAGYVSHLDDDGLLTVSRWYEPERWGETARVLRLMGAALREQGIERPEDHVACLYTTGYMAVAVSTTVARRRPLDDHDREVLAALAREKGFQVLWPPIDGLTAEAPFDAAAAIRGDADFVAGAPFDMSLPTDERPFFFNIDYPFWSWLEAIRHGDAGRGSLATLVFGLALFLLGTAGLYLNVRPLRLAAGTPGVPTTVPLGPILYFGGIGAGFMAVEMALIQRYIVFLGHPTYALSVVLFSLLLGGGFGSMATERLRNAGRDVRIAIAAVVLGCLFAATLLPVALDAARMLPVEARVALAVVGILPQALCMGMIWPLGVRLLSERGLGTLTPWMWAINGYCGVLSSVAAMFLATLGGYSAVLLLAVALYGVTAASVSMRWPPTQPTTP